MLVDHCVSGLILLFTVRALASWHARHNWPLEASRTRNICDTGSWFCTCGSWQLVHSTVPPIKATLFSGSAVFPVEVKLATKWGASFKGVFKLNGWEPLRSTPSKSV